MNKFFLPKPLLNFCHSSPFLLDVESNWDFEESQSMGLSIYEDKNHVFVEASLPGVPSDKIELSFDNGRLSIDGEKQEEEKGRKYYKKASSSFSYRAVIPSYVDETKEPEATYKDGIMTITFLKNGKKKKQIPIKRIS